MLLTLTLLMAGVAADYVNTSFAPHNFAIFADASHTGSHFHIRSPSAGKQGKDGQYRNSARYSSRPRPKNLCIAIELRSLLGR